MSVELECKAIVPYVIRGIAGFLHRTDGYGLYQLLLLFSLNLSKHPVHGLGHFSGIT